MVVPAPRLTGIQLGPLQTAFKPGFSQGALHLRPQGSKTPDLGVRSLDSNPQLPLAFCLSLSLSKSFSLSGP